MHVEQQQPMLIPFEKWVVASYSSWNTVVLINVQFQKYFDQTVTSKHKVQQLLNLCGQTLAREFKLF